ncbi:MAG TPA: hypothetical protein DCF68_21815 [Cyanothece sp. UBA12306]|nr:hypothetical protein [Cyanothece sp. UBA12306]
MLKLRNLAPLVTAVLSLTAVDPAQAGLRAVKTEDIIVNAETFLDPFGRSFPGITGIENVKIREDGPIAPIISTYSFTFQQDPFDTVFEPAPPLNTTCDLTQTSSSLCFWNNQTLANTALTAVTDAINIKQPDIGEIVADSTTAPPFLNPFRSPSFIVPISFDGTEISFTRSTYDGLDWNVETLNGTIDPGTSDMYAKVELTDRRLEIPESSNVLGVIGVGLFFFVSQRKSIIS